MSLIVVNFEPTQSTYLTYNNFAMFYHLLLVIHKHILMNANIQQKDELTWDPLELERVHLQLAHQEVFQTLS